MLAISLSFKVLILFCLFDCMWKLFSSPHGPHSDSLNPLVEPWRLKTLFPSQPTPERMYSIERKPAETAGKVVAGIWRTCIQQYTCFIHLLYADIQVEMCTGGLIRNLGLWQWGYASEKEFPLSKVENQADIQPVYTDIHRRYTLNMCIKLRIEG